MNVSYPKECAKEIVEVLEKHNVTIFDMDRVLEIAREMACSSTHIQSDKESDITNAMKDVGKSPFNC